MKFIIRLFCALVLLPATYCVAANDFSQHIAGSTILDEKNSLHTTVRIPMSIIEFKEATTTNLTSGFFAANEISVDGDVHIQLIDFPIKVSPKNIYKKFVDELTSSGFELLYQCISNDCGKKDGFRLYFSSRLNDVNESQHYVVASHGKVYKIFYVAEIDGQSRGYSLEVSTHSATGIAFSNNLVPFDLGSAILNNSSKLIIDNWLSAMPRNTKIVSVLGHADSSGSLEKNIELAEARAKIVNEYIVSKLKSAAMPKIFSLSVANLARPLNGSRGRYVELMAHLPE